MLYRGIFTYLLVISFDDRVFPQCTQGKIEFGFAEHYFPILARKLLVYLLPPLQHALVGKEKPLWVRNPVLLSQQHLH